MRIATWNVNSVNARLPRVLSWLEHVRPDVCCLQEVKCAPAAFPFTEFRQHGYEAAVHAAGRWNGVALLSRVGLAEVRRGLHEYPDVQTSCPSGHLETTRVFTPVSVGGAAPAPAAAGGCCGGGGCD